MEFWLPIIWAGIIALGVFIYVCLDGFDLGIGILFLTRDSVDDRDVMMNTVAPVWDGNETWLIIGGAGLMGTFPLAYALIMPALYLPLLAMLLALIFRGVAFEFRFKADSSKPFWDRAFFAASTLAAFTQGVMLGAFVEGFAVTGTGLTETRFVGGAFDWLSPFTLFVGVAVIAGYALLGACWLNLKTEGPLQAHARRFALPLLAVVLVAIGLVSLWMIVFDPYVRSIWFNFPNIVFLAPVPLLTALLAVGFYRGIKSGAELSPYLYAIGLFGLGYFGLVISHVPYIVPPSVTIWDAAASPDTQIFILVGASVCLPVIMGYTIYVYRVFRGKVTVDAGYH